MSFISSYYLGIQYPSIPLNLVIIKVKHFANNPTDIKLFMNMVDKHNLKTKQADYYMDLLKYGHNIEDPKGCMKN